MMIQETNRGQLYPPKPLMKNPGPRRMYKELAEAALRNSFELSSQHLLKQLTATYLHRIRPVELRPMYNPKVNNFIRAIKPDTTPEQFDALVATIEDYDYEDGDSYGITACTQAAREGNIRLVEHLVKKGEVHLLNIADSWGGTALGYVSRLADKQAAYEQSKKMIKLGADVNLDYPLWEGKHLHQQTPIRWAILSCNINLVRLLLKHGAVMPTNLSDLSASSNDPTYEVNKYYYIREDWIEKINTIEKIVDNDKRKAKLFLAGVMKQENKNSVLQKLPFDIINKIFKKICKKDEYDVHLR